MKKFSLSIYLLLLIATGSLSYYNSQAFSNDADTPPYSSMWEQGSDSLELSKYKINPPVAVGHLQVFLIEGNEELSDKEYATLTEAMEKNLVTVQETGSVNELSIDNNSDKYVFIHSGDIVKGGKQDRTIAYDVIIPPNTKNIPLQSFCVEQGRWQQRGGEEVSEFGSNSKMLSSKKLKMAARYDNNQSKVWESVAEQQDELNGNMVEYDGFADSSADVYSDESASSLQLTLESEEVKVMTTDIEKQIKDLVAQNDNAIGFAYAINGEIYGVDIYNNRQLFDDLWTKISSSIATETVATDEEEDFEYASREDVRKFIAAVNDSNVAESEKKINGTTEMKTKENNDGTLEFNTIDKQEKNWVHRNYMKRN
ncbi:MAG: hypothetical protein NXI20_22745 [bacterium]|nr:hypothetical protein [bacterium]